jgi:hypothetical protein
MNILLYTNYYFEAIRQFIPVSRTQGVLGGSLNNISVLVAERVIDFFKRVEIDH